LQLKHVEAFKTILPLVGNKLVCIRQLHREYTILIIKLNMLFPKLDVKHNLAISVYRLLNPAYKLKNFIGYNSTLKLKLKENDLSRYK
jgi:hypothetical protein